MRWVAVLLLLSACATLSPDPRSQLSRAVLDRIDSPLLLAELPALGVAATLVPKGQRAGRDTWTTADAVSLTFADGVLVATRGLGFDLMSADANATRAALRGGEGGGAYTRFHTTLDGEGQTVFHSLSCRVASVTPERLAIVGRVHTVRRIEEACASPEAQVTNIYWRGVDGLIWKSRQWLGPEAGYLLTERLVR